MCKLCVNWGQTTFFSASRNNLIGKKTPNESIHADREWPPFFSLNIPARLVILVVIREFNTGGLKMPNQALYYPWIEIRDEQ